MDRGVWARWFMGSVALAMVFLIGRVDSDKVELGNTTNVLEGYGRLAERVRVVGSTESVRWVFPGSGVKVFDVPSEFDLRYSYAIKSIVVNFNVQIAFCSNFGELVKEYFRGFKIEGVDKVSRAFSSDWSKAGISKVFGINESFVADNYGYVFLKIAQTRDLKTMLRIPRGLDISDAIAEAARNVKINDTDSADRFIAQFGTHYVSSFATGDFIYQVYVDSPSYLRYLKNHISRTGLAGMDAYERDLMFSPWHTLHTGKILSASGNRSIEAWAEQSLEGSYRNERDEKYSSIVQIYSDSQLTRQLDDLLEDRALLEMELKILTPVFKNPEIREWFENYVNKRLYHLSVKNDLREQSPTGISVTNV